MTSHQEALTNLSPETGSVLLSVIRSRMESNGTFRKNTLQRDTTAAMFVTVWTWESFDSWGLLILGRRLLPFPADSGDVRADLST